MLRYFDLNNRAFKGIMKEAGLLGHTSLDRLPSLTESEYDKIVEALSEGERELLRDKVLEVLLDEERVALPEEETEALLEALKAYQEEKKVLLDEEEETREKEKEAMLEEEDAPKEEELEVLLKEEEEPSKELEIELAEEPKEEAPGKTEPSERESREEKQKVEKETPKKEEQKKETPKKEAPKKEAPPPSPPRYRLETFTQFLMYLGIFIGVLFSSAVSQFQSGEEINLTFTASTVVISAIISLILVPLVYEKLRLKPDYPLLIQFGLFVQQGVFWHVLFNSLGKVMALN